MPANAYTRSFISMAFSTKAQTGSTAPILMEIRDAPSLYVGFAVMEVRHNPVWTRCGGSGHSQ
jgi:hypothetical protein